MAMLHRPTCVRGVSCGSPLRLDRQEPTPRRPDAASRRAARWIAEESGACLLVAAAACVSARSLRPKGACRQSAIVPRRSVRLQALRVSSSTEVFFFVDREADGKPVQLAVADGAPASAGGPSDSWVELRYLLGDPLQRRIQITSRASAELPQTSMAALWKAVGGNESGSTSDSSLPDAWAKLQTIQCYGVQWPLSLQGVSGSLEEGAEIRGSIQVLDQEIRRFRWEVERIQVSNEQALICLNGQVEEDDAAVKHTLEFKATGSGTCQVSSEVCYTPSPPLQTFLNAAGGRMAVSDGNQEVLRRLCSSAMGIQQSFEPTGFYNSIGRLIDLMAPFEDTARERMTELAGLSPSAGSSTALSVMEIGCGTGRWAKQLLSSTPCSVSRYLGIDSSETMAALAASELGSIPAASVINTDARDLEEDNMELHKAVNSSLLGGPPDRIVAAYVFDILDNEDTTVVLEACAKLLRASGGALAVASICEGSPVMTAWQAVWDQNPGLVGGCRPVAMGATLRSLGWNVEAEEQISSFGYLSQVIVARPPSQ